MSVAGLLLAAGAGTRMGRPKALVHDDDGPWLGRGVATLTAGGCATVTVVLGAGADEAVPLLDGLGVDLVLAADWAEGMSASLGAGLRALAGSEATACLVHLVDLPDVTPEVIARLVATGRRPARRPGQGDVRRPPGPPGAARPRPLGGCPGDAGRRRGRPGLPRRPPHRRRGVRRPRHRARRGPSALTLG